MSWFEKKVHAYEQMRFAQEPNRPVQPFSWGLEHIGGDANEPDPHGFMHRFVEQTLARSDQWLATTAASDYSVEDSVLRFTSAITSPWSQNNQVYGQLFRAQRRGPAVIVLAQWNSRWDEQQAVCRWLQRLGITAIKMSLPYHDRRAIPGHPRADHLVGSNLGLTIQANRQAVLDVRRTVRWLETQGYDRLGILGTSIGSAIGFITLCHEPALRTGAFLHVSTYFGNVVATGLTTKNVWEGIQGSLSLEQTRHFWAPISPFPYISKLEGSGKKILAISGRYDPTFWHKYTKEFLKAVRRDGLRCETMSLPCGHYSLGVAPFKHLAGYRFGTFLRRALA